MRVDAMHADGGAESPRLRARRQRHEQPLGMHGHYALHTPPDEIGQRSLADRTRERDEAAPVPRAHGPQRCEPRVHAGRKNGVCEPVSESTVVTSGPSPSRVRPGWDGLSRRHDSNDLALGAAGADEAAIAGRSSSTSVECIVHQRHAAKRPVLLGEVPSPLTVTQVVRIGGNVDEVRHLESAGSSAYGIGIEQC